MAPGRRQHPMSRRDFLLRAGGTAIAVPSLAAILAACQKPGTAPSGGGASSSSGDIPIANPQNPVTLPVTSEPIATSTPIESGTLQVYNWSDYMYKKVLAAFEDQYKRQGRVDHVQQHGGGDPEARRRAGAGRRLLPDDRLRPAPGPDGPPSAVEPRPDPQHGQHVARVLRPGPWYDLGWNYTVPYTIYTTGVAYRRDRIDDAAAAAAGYEMYFDPAFKGAVSYYDSYRDALGQMLLRNSVTDPDTGDPAAIDAAKQAILDMIHAERGTPHDQRDLREAPRGRVHDLAVLVWRHRGGAVLSAEGHAGVDPGLLVSGGQERA